MNPRAAFGLSVLLGLVSSSVAAFLLVAPALRMLDSRTALLWLVAPHMFLRFIGLSFLVPGVVSAYLPKKGQRRLPTAILSLASLPSLRALG